jgi:hypothetical protein
VTHFTTACSQGSPAVKESLTQVTNVSCKGLNGEDHPLPAEVAACLSLTQRYQAHLDIILKGFAICNWQELQLIIQGNASIYASAVIAAGIDTAVGTAVAAAAVPTVTAAVAAIAAIAATATFFQHHSKPLVGVAVQVVVHLRSKQQQQQQQ